MWFKLLLRNPVQKKLKLEDGYEFSVILATLWVPDWAMASEPI